MPTCKIPFGDTGYFTQIILDYLDNNTGLQPFFGRFPTVDNFKEQIAQKQFPLGSRLILSNALRSQYEDLRTNQAVVDNIAVLGSPKTFTVTTGHQLNLFTGPLYFLIKIADTIALSRKLANHYPEFNFVPVYWMATEDHDFDEINHFNFHEKKLAWNRASGGPVGRLGTDGLEEVFNHFSQELGPGKNADALRELFKNAYLEHDNLTVATRYLANELFGSYGLVIVDGNDRELKSSFVPFVLKELYTEFSYEAVSQSSAQLGYPAQVHPREINLFYMKNGLRERIVRDENGFSVLETDISFTAETIANELENHPERFSPNVILRPLYQEVVLPNLCYIGGGGEIAYWLQLKSMFEQAQVLFPILIVRDSVLMANEKHEKKLKALGLEWKDLFRPDEKLSAIIAKKHSSLDLDFSDQKRALEKQFDNLLHTAQKTHPSFLSAVKAQQVRQLKGLEKLEKRLLSAEKKRLADVVHRALALRAELFPKGSLQERKANFAEFYQTHGAELIEKLLAELDPLDPQFRVIVS